jgi:hypothetical protein
MNLQEVLHMRHDRNSGVSCDNHLFESRYKIILSFLRLAGIPLNFPSPSKVQILYNTLCVVCYYSTFMCALMDTFVHRYDLMQAMKKIRVFFAMSVAVWVHFNLRYATLYSVCSIKS